MKKYLILLFITIMSFQLKAQNYEKLTDSALHVMWKAKDTVGERKALNLYEQAFKLYPAKIENLGRYKASVLAGDLLELDKAFRYLGPVAKDGVEHSQGWDFIVGNSFKDEFKNLLKDNRWKKLTVDANIQKAEFFKNLMKEQAEFESAGLKSIRFNQTEDGKAAYQKIKGFNNFAIKTHRNYSIKFKVTDSLSTSYFVSLPKNYDPKKKYALLFFLHGAVQSNNFTAYQDKGILEGWNRFYTKYSALHDVIMVYPNASKKYNWMTPDDGFFMIPAMLKEIKQAVNIDDNKVFITGHSNGATGSFSYLMKEQSPFAGFYGFNTRPKVRTGGTFVKNILNRSYFNVSTDQDYYYPPDANDSLNVIMKKLGADYQDHRYKGFPHWFPQFDESEPAYPLLFADLAVRKRNPFHHEIYWECDQVKYGKADWLQINQMDTAGRPASWYNRVNFDILKLLAYDKDENLVKKDTLLKAFDFPLRSAAVKGYYKNNEFHLETSSVKSLTVFISPDMVDMSKPVIIYINGVKKAEKRPVYNKQLIIDKFNADYDRKAIWVDKVEVII